MTTDREVNDLMADMEAFSHAMVNLIDEHDWDDNRVLQVLGVWLTFMFNNAAWPDVDTVFRGFIRTLIGAHERRTKEQRELH